MNPRARLAALTVLLVALGVTGSTGILSASAQAPAGTEITGKGVGGVTLGAKYKTLRGQGLLGKKNKGCELAGPRAAGAPLVAPLVGSVDLSQKKKKPRRVKDILLRGGPATARGIGIGSTKAQVQAAFPEATEDAGTFGLTAIKVPASAGGPFAFGVDAASGAVTVIGIPFIPFCE